MREHLVDVKYELLTSTDSLEYRINLITSRMDGEIDQAKNGFGRQIPAFPLLNRK